MKHEGERLLDREVEAEADLGRDDLRRVEETPVGDRVPRQVECPTPWIPTRGRCRNGRSGRGPCVAAAAVQMTAAGRAIVTACFMAGPP